MPDQLKVRSAVIHRHAGRGILTHLYVDGEHAAVRFGDDRLATRVKLADLTAMPADMPPCLPGPVSFAQAPFAICWPLERAGNWVDPATVQR